LFRLSELDRTALVIDISEGRDVYVAIAEPGTQLLFFEPWFCGVWKPSDVDECGVEALKLVLHLVYGPVSIAQGV
jgi:hypothetical protein